MRWLGAARGPVAAALGPGPWEGLAEEMARIGYRVLVVEDARALDGALAAEGMPDDVTVLAQGPGAREAVPWAALNAHRTRRLILLSPEGILHPPPPKAPPRRLARVPLLGRWLAAGAPLAPRPPLQEAEHRAVARAGTPVIALWAAEDPRVPLRALGDLALWNRQAKHEVIEGAGADLLPTHAARVAGTLREVLREDF